MTTGTRRKIGRADASRVSGAPSLRAQPAAATAPAQDGPPGITGPWCSHLSIQCAGLHAAAGLEKVLAFAQDNEREFMQGVARGPDAGRPRPRTGLRDRPADNDPVMMIEQVRSFATRRSARWSTAPVDPPSLAPRYST